MAERINHDRAINLLPAPIREKVLAKLVAGEPSRSISAFLLQHGHKISFAAVARYRRVDLPRHLALVRKLRQAEVLSGSNELASQSDAKITNQLLAADLVDQRLNAKFDRYDEWFLQAGQSKDFTALTSIDKAETAAIRLHAELTGRLQQNASNVQVQIVIGDKSSDTEPVRLDDAPEDTIDMALPHNR